MRREGSKKQILRRESMAQEGRLMKWNKLRRRRRRKAWKSGEGGVWWNWKLSAMRWPKKWRSQPSIWRHGAAESAAGEKLWLFTSRLSRTASPAHRNNLEAGTDASLSASKAYILRRTPGETISVQRGLCSYSYVLCWWERLFLLTIQPFLWCRSSWHWLLRKQAAEATCSLGRRGCWESSEVHGLITERPLSPMLFCLAQRKAFREYCAAALGEILKYDIQKWRPDVRNGSCLCPSHTRRNKLR